MSTTPRFSKMFRLGLALVALVLGFARTSFAHTVGLSRLTFELKDQSASAELQLARADALAVMNSLDQDRNGTVESSEVEAQAEPFAKLITTKLRVSLPTGDLCAASQHTSTLDSADGVVVRATWQCGRSSESVTIDASSLLEVLPSGHRLIATSARGSAQAGESILYRGQAQTSVSSGRTDTPTSSRPLPKILLEYLLLGFEHILLGIDHLVFLFGILLLGGRFKAIVWMITAFTVAHSITLGLAVLGVIMPSPQWIEPLIALSVAYVGIENFVLKNNDNRWRVTALFGLVHGFGFAGALGAISLPTSQIPPALFAFNVGVELGQLLVLGVTLPIIWRLRQIEWVREKGSRIASAAIVCAGIVWFVTRVAETAQG